MNRATLRTEHEHAAVVAAAVRPDNTPEVATDVEGETVVTTIERERLGSLRATVDDYWRALAAADQTVRLVSESDEVDP